MIGGGRALLAWGGMNVYVLTLGLLAYLWRVGRLFESFCVGGRRGARSRVPAAKLVLLGKKGRAGCSMQVTKL
jgi:hypothetical protein